MLHNIFKIICIFTFECQKCFIAKNEIVSTDVIKSSRSGNKFKIVNQKTDKRVMCTLII